MSGRKEFSAFARFAKSELLQLNQGNNAEAVIKLRDVDVGRCNAGHLECDLARLLGTKLGETGRAHEMFVCVMLSNSKKVSRLRSQVARSFGARHNKRTSSI